MIFMVLNVSLLARPDALPPMDNMPIPGGAPGGSIPDSNISVNMFAALKNWWEMSVNPYRGSAIYLLLLILSVVMFVPVICIILAMSVLYSYGNFLFIAIIVDVILYLLRGLFGTNFFEQAFGRYYKLFPEAGKRHYEKDYEKWLKRHHKDFKDDAFDEDDEDTFYEDDKEYDEDFYEDEEGYYEDEDEDEDDYYEDEDYEDGEYYEDEEDYEDEDEDYVEEKVPKTAGTFDFFAGCNSKESLDKKYKSLVKLYHPDNMDGDTKALQEINVQYDKAKKRFG